MLTSCKRQRIAGTSIACHWPSISRSASSNLVSQSRADFPNAFMKHLYELTSCHIPDVIGMLASRGQICKKKMASTRVIFMKKTMGAPEAARTMHVGLNYTYALLKTGKLPGRLVNGQWEIDVADVQARI